MSNDVASTTTHKVLWHLVPFCMLLFFVQIMDKTNVSYAALEMNPQLGFTPEIYGFAAGVFFLGAFLFEIPSNLVLARFGARRWLARIMVSWGLIVIGMAWVHSARSFYMLRFLLGAAEAGLLPGVLYYLGTWIPKQRRGTGLSALMSVSAIGAIIAAPLSTGIMELRGTLGLSGWQWVFVLEGVATVVIGALTLRYLPDRAAEAVWLTSEERGWLAETLSRDAEVKQRFGVTGFKAGFFDRRVLIGFAISFLLVFCNFGTVLWLPQMIKAFGGLTNMQVGLLSVLPYACGAVGMFLCGRSSDRSGDRRWHLVACGAVATLGYLCAGLASSNLWVFIGLCVASAGILSTFGIFWAHAADLLGGAAAAGGLAFINTASQLGGFLGPMMIGYLRQTTHDYRESMLLMAGGALLTALVALALRNQPAKSNVEPSRALA